MTLCIDYDGKLVLIEHKWGIFRIYTERFLKKILCREEDCGFVDSSVLNKLMVKGCYWRDKVFNAYP